MSSGGSNSKNVDLDDDAKSSERVHVSERPPKDGDSDMASMQTSDLIDRPLCDRAERLVTVHQLTFDPLSVRRELAKAVILHDYPLSIVGHHGFKALFASVFPMVSQSTLKDDILKIYDFERCKTAGLFDEARSRVAITTDKWVSYDQKKHFIAITGHMIDDEWKVHRRTMRFVNVPCLYTNESVAKMTVECLFDWDVATKVSTIAIENSSAESNDHGLSDILINHLSGTSLLLGGKLLHMGCFARTVSSMAKEGIDLIGDVIQKIRDSILFWTATPQREREFKEASRELCISDSRGFKLVLDSLSKWNTTFLMLKKALVYKNVFCHLKREESQYLCLPTEEEWELAQEICPKLEFLYTMMIRVSKYHTANLGFRHLFIVKHTLSKWVLCDNLMVRKMATKMLEKFDKYWEQVRDIFAVASVFDHRYKLKFVRFSFQKIYGSEAHNETERIRQICYNLFNEYQSKHSFEKTNSDDDADMPSSSLTDSSDFDFESRWNLHQLNERKRKREKKPELDAYLEQKLVPIYGNVEEVNILGWWEHDSNYPILQKMVRDILAIPICSVAPEHMFDTGHRVLSPHRSSLHPTMVETLMCTQSWLWTSIKGSYSVTNSYSWGTTDDYAVVEDQATEAVKR